MLEEQAVICPLKPYGVVPVRLGKRFSKISAPDTLVTDLSAERSTAQDSLDLARKRKACDIGDMVIERVFFRGAAEELESVLAAVPVCPRSKMPETLAGRLDRSESLESTLELIVELRAVERA